MSDNDSTGRQNRPSKKRVVKSLFGIAAILAGVVVTNFIGLPHPHVDPPSIPFPNLPDWVGPTLRWGKFVVLIVIVGLFIAGAIEDDKRDKNDQREELA